MESQGSESPSRVYRGHAFYYTEPPLRCPDRLSNHGLFFQTLKTTPCCPLLGNKENRKLSPQIHLDYQDLDWLLLQIRPHSLSQPRGHVCDECSREIWRISWKPP